MTIKKLLENAKKRCEIWNKEQPKHQQEESIFLLYEISENASQLIHNESKLKISQLVKEMAFYMLGKQEETFLEHLQEWAEELFEE